MKKRKSKMRKSARKGRKAGRAGRRGKARKQKKTQKKSSGLNLGKVRQCPACGSKKVRYLKSSDELVCNDCGEIFAVLAPDDEKRYEKASDII